MSIQWTLVASVLMVEVVLVTLLILPFIRPRTWQRFFKSRFLKSIESQAHIYGMVFMLILLLLFFDSVREMSKYAGELHSEQPGSRHVDSELQLSMKLFRSQRNFYIAGFALFLFFVIRRVVSLITILAQSSIQAEAAIKQAKSASDVASNLMKDDKKPDGSSGGPSHEVDDLKKALEAKGKEFDTLQASMDALKKQSKNLTDEYDRLTNEHKALLKKQKVDGDSKKDN